MTKPIRESPRPATLLTEIAEESAPHKPAGLSLRLEAEVVEELKSAATAARSSVNELVGKLIKATIRLPPFSLRLPEELTRLLRSDVVVEPIREAIVDEFQKRAVARLRWSSFPRESLSLTDVRVNVASGGIELYWAFTHDRPLNWTLSGGDSHIITETKASGIVTLQTSERPSISQFTVDFLHSITTEKQKADGFIDDDLPF